MKWHRTTFCVKSLVVRSTHTTRMARKLVSTQSSHSQIHGRPLLPQSYPHQTNSTQFLFRSVTKQKISKGRITVNWGEKKGLKKQVLAQFQQQNVQIYDPKYFS